MLSAKMKFINVEGGKVGRASKVLQQGQLCREVISNSPWKLLVQLIATQILYTLMLPVPTRLLFQFSDVLLSENKSSRVSFRYPKHFQQSNEKWEKMKCMISSWKREVYWRQLIRLQIRAWKGRSKSHVRPNIYSRTFKKNKFHLWSDAHLNRTTVRVTAKSPEVGIKFHVFNLFSEEVQPKQQPWPRLCRTSPRLNAPR